MAGAALPPGCVLAEFSEEAVFQVARRIERLDARQLYLDQVCGADTALRSRVDALLRAHDEEPSFLERRAATIPVYGSESVASGHGAGGATATFVEASCAGAVIAGKYKSLNGSASAI